MTDVAERHRYVGVYPGGCDACGRARSALVHGGEYRDVVDALSGRYCFWESDGQEIEVAYAPDVGKVYVAVRSTFGAAAITIPVGRYLDIADAVRAVVPDAAEKP